MSIARSSLVVGLSSVVSRLLGFARDVLLAAALGAGPAADAFFAAFRIPNLLRRMLGEGGLHPAIVPALTGVPDARKRAGEILGGAGLVVLAATAVAELGAGALVLLAGPGLARHPETLALATDYTRLLLPLVASVALAAALGAVLAAWRHFAAAALSGLILNGALIAALLAPAPSGLERATWLAIAASLGGVLQLAVLALAAPRAIPGLRWRLPALHGLRAGRLLARAVAAAVTSAAIHVFVFAGAQVASFMPSGLSWLHYAERLAQLPTSLVAVLAGIVLLPEMAARAVAGDRPGLLALQNDALHLALLVACPAAAGLALLADPIAGILFERGAFGAADRAGTAAALIGLAPLVPIAAAGKVLAQTLYATGTLRPAVIATLAGFAVALGGGAVLAPAFGIGGVALAVSAGALLHGGLIALALRARGLWQGAGLTARTARIGAATALMALAVRLLEALLPASALALAFFCTAGALVYIGAVVFCGAIPGDWRRLVRKRPGARAAS
ncbi:murein biosynthesis integral membrane protein MurJ [Microvirga massiliensis]|uniref:murein biosynthesis integral membrane protein MurJ n=1 Tax=Microvirga massiliensis TaxID=1033741 RepID=UPI0006616408|nr:murein biosynthesis integral membrane protein MurJ [Microvirga massiliensis]